MPEARLQRTRDNHASVDPFNSLALIYINHAREMVRQGQKEEARIALVEAARLLGSELARECVCGHGVNSHDDLDGETHECQICNCDQFRDVN